MQSGAISPSWLRCSFSLLLGWLPCLTAYGKVDDEGGKKPVSYVHDVMPILRANCLGCHQPAKAQGSYVMTDFQKLLAGGESGTPSIVPGDPASSHLIDLITPKDGKAEMPRSKPPLSQEEVDLLKRWVAEGARDDSPPAKPSFDAANPPTYAQPPVITSIDVSPDGSKLAPRRP